MDMKAPEDATSGVDHAALILAATAGAVTVALGDGAYGWFSTFVGMTLTLLVLAFHRPTPPTPVRRSWLIRLAFGFTLTLCLFIAVAWGLQYWTTSPWLALLILTVPSVLIAVMEPRIGHALDKE
jgi:hypothetical protein